MGGNRISVEKEKKETKCVSGNRISVEKKGNKLAGWKQNFR